MITSFRENPKSMLVSTHPTLHVSTTEQEVACTVRLNTQWQLMLIPTPTPHIHKSEHLTPELWPYQCLACKCTMQSWLMVLWWHNAAKNVEIFLEMGDTTEIGPIFNWLSKFFQKVNNFDKKSCEMFPLKGRQHDRKHVWFLMGG